MSLQADVFEPDVVRSAIKGLLHSAQAKDKFEKEWKADVDKRVKAWTSHKDNKRTPLFQLQWESEVVQYVDYINSKLSVHGNSGPLAKDAIRTLDKGIPLLGPKFCPPSFLHSMRRKATPDIRPQDAYISEITIIHPVFYPTTFTGCPSCQSPNIGWDGWNGTGARAVYGIRTNERAIGYQLRCRDCKENKASGGYCFATTNYMLWEKWEHWRVPRSIPHFLKRAAVTHELYDLIVELRPSSTSVGLAEHFKQLHLLEYRQRMLEYLLYYKTRRKNPFSTRNCIQPFSSPTDEEGYGDSFITNDLITDLYLDFIAKGRKSESIEYAQTRTAKSLSLDNTFKSSAKATMVDSNGVRQNPMNGGVLSLLNEEGEGVSWRYCLSYSAAEIREMLLEIRKRLEEMGLPLPSSVTIDNCCTVRRFIHEALGQNVAVCLDVYHFMIRYGMAILGGTRNTHRKEVLADIRNAIIKTPAQKNRPATYWSQTEQEIKIVEAYNKWLQYSGIWSAAAPKIHADQLEHVQKGCLARPREDIAMDGSRIEGSHKGWNSLQRAHSSGIEIYTGLAFDFFLRRNIRIGWSRVESGRRTINLYEFVESTFSSHHVQLVNHTANVFNSLLEDEPANLVSNNHLRAYPTLPPVKARESMGLVESAHTQTFGGLVEAETPNIPENIRLDSEVYMLEDIEAQMAEMDQGQLVRSLNVDEQMLHIPLAQKSRPICQEPPANATISQPQKRKVGCAEYEPEPVGDDTPGDQDLTGSHSEDTPSDPKRQRTAAPLSPSTQAETGLGDGDADLDSADEIPALDLDLELTSDAETDNIGSTIDCEPTDSVVADSILVPSAGLATASSSAVASSAHALFRFQTTLDRSAAGNVVHSAPTGPPTAGARRVNRDQTCLEELRRPLKLPDVLRAQGLTRSQLLFSVGTAIHPQALEIKGDDEFYLFMDLRAQHQWTSFGMTAQKWASATSIYNAQLEACSKKKGFQFIKKNPRALSEKLNEIEPKIIERVSRNNYVSRKNNSEVFWRRHCNAVPALIGKIELDSNGFNNNSAVSDGQADPSQLKQRKRPVCSRCKTIMYFPGNKKANHKKGYCADGARSTDPKKKKILPTGEDNHANIPAITMGDYNAGDDTGNNEANDTGKGTTAEDSDALAPWPQPPGIFVTGNMFDPAKFLFAVRDLYEKVADHRAHNNPDVPCEYTLEDQAFSQMLSARTKVIDAHSYFRLFDLTFTSGNTYESMVIEHDGRRYLRMDCL